MNRLVQELFEKCEEKIRAKMDNIQELKKQVRGLDSDAENDDDLDDVDEDGKRKKRKPPKKDKMCKKYLESFYDEYDIKQREEKGIKTKKHQGLEGHKVPWHCDGIKKKTCKYGHNPLDLNAIEPENPKQLSLKDEKKKNLNTVIQVQQQRLKHNKA